MVMFSYSVLNPAKLDIRVGKITNVEKHPDADTLYVEKVDLGEEKERTVVSGLVKYLKPEDLLNKHVVLLCNLKPAKMRNILSEAMVLAATSPDGAKVELLKPPQGSKPGDCLHFDGFVGEPEKVLNSKKKVWENIQPNLSTNQKLEAQLVLDGKSHVLKSNVGVCKVTSIAGGSIK
jgi:methionine--tRNA ligase beta chain